jgi:phosphomannomutase
MTLLMNGFIWENQTEPIIRIYTEAPSQAQADTLALPIESKAVAGI